MLLAAAVVATGFCTLTRASPAKNGPARPGPAPAFAVFALLTAAVVVTKYRSQHEVCLDADVGDVADVDPWPGFKVVAARV